MKPKRWMPKMRSAILIEIARERGRAIAMAREHPTLTQVELTKGASKTVAWVRNDLAHLGSRCIVEGLVGVWTVTAVYETQRTIASEDGTETC